jgi:tetratricopeptide (TPR) repeat protein
MNILVASRGLVFYLEKTLVPINLSCLYPFPKPGHIPVSFFISPFIVAGCVWLIVFSRRYTRAVIFGSLFFLAAILPSLQIVSWGNAIAADRFTYLPCIGFSYIAAEGFSALLMRKQWRYNSIVKPALTVCLIAVIFVLMSLTWQRCQVWKDSLSLWSDAIEKSPSNEINPQYVDAYNNRGMAYAAKGNYDQAISDFNKTIEINPVYVDAYNNRGNVYYSKGRYDRAILDYTKAIEINPRKADFYYNRGTAYAAKGEYDRAISDFNKAIEINPQEAGTYNNRGNAYYAKGIYDRAISDYTKTIEINPQYAGAYHNRAKCYYVERDYDKAWDDVRRIQGLGYSVDPDFINKLKKASQ